MLHRTLFCSASVTTLLVPLPPFRVARIDDSLTSEKVLAILLNGTLSKMLNRAQEKRLLLDSDTSDVVMAVDWGWAANFTALPTQAVSRYNGQRIGTGAIDSTGLEMAISEVPKHLVPMYFHSNSSLPLRVKPLRSRTSATVEGDDSFPAGP